MSCSLHIYTTYQPCGSYLASTPGIKAHRTKILLGPLPSSKSVTNFIYYFVLALEAKSKWPMSSVTPPALLSRLGDSFWPTLEGKSFLRSRVRVIQSYLGGFPCSHELIPLSNSVAISTPLLHESEKWPVDREALGLLTVIKSES